MFFWIDVAIYGAGSVLLAWSLLQVRRGRSPLRPPESTPNPPIAIELLFIPITAYFLALLLVQEWMLPRPGEPAINLRTVQAHANNLVQLAGLAACVAAAVIGPWKHPLNFLVGRLEWKRGAAMVAGLALTSLTLTTLTLWLTQKVLNVLWPNELPNTHGTIQALETESPGLLGLVSLYGGAALIAPLAEECFFRGLLQPAVTSWIGRRTIGILIAAVAFGLIHLNQPHAVPALVVFGILLGLARVWSGSLLVPILVHILFNLRTLIWHAAGAMPSGG